VLVRLDAFARKKDQRLAAVTEGFREYLLITSRDLFPSLAQNRVQAAAAPALHASVASFPPLVAHSTMYAGGGSGSVGPSGAAAVGGEGSGHASQPHPNLEVESHEPGPVDRNQEGETSSPPRRRPRKERHRLRGRSRSRDRTQGGGEGDEFGRDHRPVHGLDQTALVKLASVVEGLCKAGDACPSLQGQGQAPCTGWHSVNLRAMGLSGWVTETALTFLRAHPMAALEQGRLAEGTEESWEKKRAAWLRDIKALAARWAANPDVALREAPPVPAPRPESTPGMERLDPAQKPGGGALPSRKALQLRAGPGPVPVRPPGSALRLRSVAVGTGGAAGARQPAPLSPLHAQRVPPEPEPAKGDDRARVAGGADPAGGLLYRAPDGGATRACRGRSCLASRAGCRRRWDARRRRR
jgi:hypothetical protein